MPWRRTCRFIIKLTYVSLTLAVMIAYTYLVIEFTYRYLYDRPTKEFSSLHSTARPNNIGELKNLEWMLAGLGSTIFFIFIRFVFVPFFWWPYCGKQRVDLVCVWMNFVEMCSEVSDLLDRFTQCRADCPLSSVDRLDHVVVELVSQENCLTAYQSVHCLLVSSSLLNAAWRMDRKGDHQPAFVWSVGRHDGSAFSPAYSWPFDDAQPLPSYCLIVSWFVSGFRILVASCHASLTILSQARHSCQRPGSRAQVGPLSAKPFRSLCHLHSPTPLGCINPLFFLLD